MIEHLLINNIVVDIESLSAVLEKELNKFKRKHKNSISSPYKLAPKIMMNLLLNFESFDQTTKTKDVYMPEERLVNFNVGYLKLNFKGKLRLTADRDGNLVEFVHSTDGPQNSYGVIEDRDLFIKIDKPVLLKYLYVRPHLKDQEMRYKMKEIEITGYKNEHLVFSTKTHMMIGSKNWVNFYLFSNKSSLITQP